MRGKGANQKEKTDHSFPLPRPPPTHMRGGGAALKVPEVSSFRNIPLLGQDGELRGAEELRGRVAGW